MAEGTQRIYLIGYRGTGKSTCARLLAARLDWDWIDLDDCIEATAGVSIKEIFAAEGEDGFRARETVELQAAAKLSRHVIACGGGVIVREENRKLLTSSGDPVVWLTAAAEVLAERIGGDATTTARRPNLTASGGLAEIESLMAKRLPWYEECATAAVSTEGRTPREIVEEIAGLV